VLVEIAVGFGIARLVETALGFAAAVEKTVGGSSLLFEPPLSLFARPAKLDDVAHP
jgi:hypothetical protein